MESGASAAASSSNVQSYQTAKGSQADPRGEEIPSLACSR